MYLKDDLNRILFQALIDADLSISGQVYIEDRPLCSDKEDVIVNTITANQSLPQTATSNVNIYVNDKKISYEGKQQSIQDAERIEELAREVIEIVEGIRINGVDCYASNYNTIQERSINQHCANVRVNWFIAKPNPNT